jgi:hypothetical protein
MFIIGERIHANFSLEWLIDCASKYLAGIMLDKLQFHTIIPLSSENFYQ